MKSIAEQLAQCDVKRKGFQDRMEAIMAKASEEGVTLDEHDSEEYDTCLADIKAIDQHATRLKAHEAIMVAKATAVIIAPGNEDGGVQLRSGGSGVLSVRRNIDPGIAYTRFALAMIRAKGNVMLAANMAKNEPGWKDTSPEVLNCLQYASDRGDTKSLVVEKAAVAASTTSSATNAGPLVQYQDMASEFINLLRPMTILGKLTKLRRVPFNIRIPRQTAGTTGAFVGEGLPKPVNALAFESITMQWYKAAVIVLMTDEVMRFSNPSIEALARQDMLEGIATYLDVRFIDPSYGGVANVSPASITNGLTATASTGSTVAAITANVKTMMAAFATANLSLASGAWIMSPVSALGLSMLRNVNDEFVFPDITINGGTWFGLPVITSNSVQPAGSPTDQHIVLIDQNEVLLADDGEIAIDMSMEASVQMDGAPASGAQSLVSLWQNNMVGLRAERYINWRTRRTGAVGILDNLNI